ncbi:uncharacterized protein ACNS7B_010047 [Menidia menidia]
MSHSAEEPSCPKFQPNIFDPSRCHDCLRQRHLHTSAEDSPEPAPQEKPQTQPEAGAKAGTGAGLGTGIGSSRGGVLTPIPSQAEEGDTSCKEDSDSLSVVSSLCDVNGGHLGYEQTSLCILSPDCELYICDGDQDDSTDSYCDRSEYSGSVSAEEEYLQIRQGFSKLSMTRLDPPSYRPRPQAWMDEAQSRNSFPRHAGFKEDRENRESGYFSLGRAAGARSLRENTPSAPFRHFERGHPIFSHRNIVPKDTIPFRNPNLGVASERPIPEFFGEDVPFESPPPDPHEVAVEVEAQVGPRSPSPTPFKIAESLASRGRKGFNRGNPSSHVSSFPQSGRHDSSRQASALQSRSPSPTRGTLQFRRSESSASLNRQNFDGGGWTQGTAARSRGSSQGAHGQRFESGTLPRNFKSFASSVKSQSGTVSDFRGTLRKAEFKSLDDLGFDSRRSSPSRRGCNSSSQMSPLKNEVTSSLSHQRGGNSRTSSPPKTTFNSLRDGCSSSPSRKSYSLSSQSILRKSESVTSLNRHSHYGRCGSPIREGYDIESQALLRNPSSRNGFNGQDGEVPTMAPPVRDYDRPSQSVLRKTSSSPVSSSRVRDSRSSSPSRRSYENLNQYQIKKKDFNGSLNGHSHDIRNSSPLRRNYDGKHSQPLLREKPECNSPIKSRHGYSSPAFSKGNDAPDQRILRKSETGSSLKSKSQHSRSSSPSIKGNTHPPGYSLLRTASNGDSNHSPQRKNFPSENKSDSNRLPHTWRGSTHSLHSSSQSLATSPSKQTTNGNKTTFVSRQTTRWTGNVRSGVTKQSYDDRCPSPNDRRPSQRTRSNSPSPRIQMLRHTSSQSSMESSESGQHSVGSAGRNREEYAMLADLPKVKRIYQREAPGHTGRPSSQQAIRRQDLFKPASHSLSKHPSTEWEDAGETEKEWQHGGSGYLSRAHSSTSLQRSGSPTADEGSSWKSNNHRSEQVQPDLLNFKKGWMSKLDDRGEWKKHWFVLTDAGLKYYRDSGAEEKDDLDGEIDLKSCMRVSEFDVEKNYGFQIQTQEAMFTLSAMTAGIRRNWIEVLKKSIRPSSSPDLTQLPDNNSDKENSHARYLPSSRQPSSRHGNAQSDVPTSGASTRRFDYVELSPVPASSSPLPAGQRESGEGQGREHSQWQEDRITSSQWEAVLSRKSGGVGSNQRSRAEDDIEKKWAEIERMPLKEMSSMPPAAPRSSSQPANEALQREVASLRQQLEQLQHGGGGGGRGGGGGGGVRGGCGPEAPCSRSLAAMERAHGHALEELQKQHRSQIRELQGEKSRLLLEESQDTARALDALRKKHREELDRAKRLGSGLTDSQMLRAQQRSETQASQRQLETLSESFSQKCVELHQAEQRNTEREKEIRRKEREAEQLRKENSDLKARFTEEMKRVRSAITDQSSEANRDKMPCELEALLRMKEIEIEYLHKEMSCLRNELQVLSMEKQLACERYAEMQAELSVMKGRTEREIQSLKEHLRLSNVALQEAQKLGNSLDH